MGNNCNFTALICYQMKKLLFLLFIFLYVHAAFAVKEKKSALRPKLVVGIVIDQMRWDYLYRYYDRYGNGGFKRLMNNGYNCQNTMVNYIPAITGPGHTCVYTGSVPSIHGIAANDWRDKTTGRKWYCVEDTTVWLAGDESKKPSMSPRNLLATTITDELKLATNFRSRVYGVAVKDRGSILPAGHLANAAYWYDDKKGIFTTSSYYKNQSPQWLQAFNKRRVADSLMTQSWTTLYPANTYTQSLPDNNNYERAFKNEQTPVFPHSTAGLPDSTRYVMMKNFPAGNTYTVKMAQACIAGEQLGHGEETDFICVSFSSTDYAGHQFAPNSMEMEDMFLRLDSDIAIFLNFLDKAVGKDEYILFLTADHGGAHNATFLNDNNIPAGLLGPGLKNELNSYLKTRFGLDSLVLEILDMQLYLNESLLSSTHIDRPTVREAICEWLDTRPEIAYTFDPEHIDRTLIPEPIRAMLINGHNRQRSGTIRWVPNPGWYESNRPTGTDHSCWNPYDTHIPLLWYGWHIPKGETHATVNMTDIAPTLAALLHIQMPNGCVGKVITGVAP